MYDYVCVLVKVDSCTYIIILLLFRAAGVTGKCLLSRIHTHTHSHTHTHTLTNERSSSIFTDPLSF